MKRTAPFNADAKPLDADVADALDVQICAAQPGDAALLERVRARVMHEVMAPSQAALHKTVRMHEVPWEQIAPGVERRLLFQTAESSSFLLRLAPGTVIAGHDHPLHEECLVLEGSFRIGSDLLLRAGDFHVGLKGVPHAAASTETGAIVFLREGRQRPETAGA